LISLDPFDFSRTPFFRMSWEVARLTPTYILDVHCVNGFSYWPWPTGPPNINATPPPCNRAGPSRSGLGGPEGPEETNSLRSLWLTGDFRTDLCLAPTEGSPGNYRRVHPRCDIHELVPYCIKHCRNFDILSISRTVQHRYIFNP